MSSIAPSRRRTKIILKGSSHITKIYGMDPKYPKYNPIMAARQALRRAFSRSPLVVEMMRENRRKAPRYNKDGSRHKVDATEHLCNVCGQWKRSVKNSKVVIDHIEPVVDPTVGFVDMNTYFARLWCPRSGLQKICGDCHRQKTNAEWFIRRFKEEQEILNGLESSRNSADIKKGLKRFTKKKLDTLPYPQEFKNRITTLRDKLKK